MLKTGVGMEVSWCNLGKGVATNIRFSCWAQHLDDHPGKVLFFPPQASEAIGIGERKSIITVQKFQIDEQNKKSFVGELYLRLMADD